jgi:Flp pilus assembly pilin Flp
MEDIFFWVAVLARRLPRHDRGVTAVEYAIMVGAVAAVVIVIAFVLGHTVSDKFSSANNQFATTT